MPSLHSVKGSCSSSSNSLSHPRSSASILPSASLSSPSLHWNSPPGPSISNRVLALEQIGSSRSVHPSESLSIPSAHSGVSFSSDTNAVSHPGSSASVSPSLSSSCRLLQVNRTSSPISFTQSQSGPCCQSNHLHRCPDRPYSCKPVHRIQHCRRLSNSKNHQHR